MNELRAGLSVSGAFLLAALLGAGPPVRAQEDASRATPPAVAAPRVPPPPAPVAAPRVPPPPAPVVAPRVPPPPAPVAAPRVPPPPAPVVAAPRVEQPRPPDWKFALIASTGAFKMSNGNQMVAGVASAFDTTSKP